MRSPIVIRIAHGFFLVLFLVGSILNVLQQDYIDALGFGLLGISNVLPLVASFQERPITSREQLIVNITGYGGLILVMLSWVGIL